MTLKEMADEYDSTAEDYLQRAKEHSKKMRLEKDMCFEHRRQLRAEIRKLRSVAYEMRYTAYYLRNYYGGNNEKV